MLLPLALHRAADGEDSALRSCEGTVMFGIHSTDHSGRDAAHAAPRLPRVCVIGPECTGKTTLARELAERFNTVYVPEYARIYAGDKSAVNAEVWWAEEFTHIAQTQARLVAEAADGARDVVICDTDAFSVWVWHRCYHPKRVRSLATLVKADPADLYLLCSPDIPFVADGIRDPELDRQRVYDMYRRELRRSARHFEEIAGPHEERVKRATAAIESLLGALVS